jgi:polo-like kinase 1
MQTDRAAARPTTQKSGGLARLPSQPKTDRPQPPVKTASSSSYTPNAPEEQKGSPPDTSSGNPDVWVKKWVDYSSKYGLGYILSNGSTGVFFNDSTKIILE